MLQKVKPHKIIAFGILLVLLLCVGCSKKPSGPIRGNKTSRIYHWPGCPNYDDISTKNRVIFGSTAEAERKGYRAAENCRSSPPK